MWFAISLNSCLYSSSPADLSSERLQAMKDITRSFGYTGSQTSPRAALRELAEGTWDYTDAHIENVDEYATAVDFGIQSAAARRGVTMDQWMGVSPTRKNVLAAIEVKTLIAEIKKLDARRAELSGEVGFGDAFKAFDGEAGEAKDAK